MTVLWFFFSLEVVLFTVTNKRRKESVLGFRSQNYWNAVMNARSSFDRSEKALYRSWFFIVSRYEIVHVVICNFCPYCPALLSCQSWMMQNSHSCPMCIWFSRKRERWWKMIDISILAPNKKQINRKWQQGSDSHLLEYILLLKLESWITFSLWHHHLLFCSRYWCLLNFSAYKHFLAAF